MATQATETQTSETQYGVASNFVGGRWLEPPGRDLLPVTNPATGEAIGRVPLSTAEDVDAAVAAAQQAFPAWRRTPPQQRVRFLFRLKELMEAELESIARTVTEEHGKTLEDARGSVRRAIENLEVACGIPSLMMGYGLEDGAAAGIDEEAIRQPLGVFAAICPFNFPAMVPFWFWPYAVACGDTFIVKPSEQVPFTQRRIFELVERAGFPPGVVNLVNGARGAVEALLDHPGIKGISFVGSTPIAKYIYARASAAGKRVQAQGGAKNMLVVMPDAELGQAVPNILGSSFGAAGQRCLAGSHLLAVGDIYEPLTGALVDAAGRLTVGDGLDPATQMGPVISAAARDRILAAIERGVTEGAALLLDGRKLDGLRTSGGYFVGPTIFGGVGPSCSLASEEVFGPVLSIERVASLQEAIERINASPYGNAASIYTQDGGAAREFRYSVECGNIGINVGVAAPMAYFPFGGFKDSFFGSLHGQGRDAIDFFTDHKIVITRWY